MASKEKIGKVVKLGELHFELADDANNRHRFAIAMDASLDAGDLPRLERDGTRVVVVYDEDTPNIAVAHRVFRAELDPGPSPQ